VIDVVFVGGGGHASVLLEAALSNAGLRVVGSVALTDGALSTAGIDRLGDDRCAADLIKRGITHAVLGVAGANDNVRRAALFDAWRGFGFRFISIVHPTAVISPRSTCGEGLQALPRSVINAGATLGANVVVNTGAIVEHDCVVADHVHIAPGATVCGGVEVGAGTLVGAGATIVPAVVIGADVVIGAGSVVLHDIQAGARVAGVPARPIARRATRGVPV
jgi:UDP-perosamine 4-acetyltransferase